MFEKWYLDFQNILKSIGFGPKVIGLGPPKYPQIDWIWNETHSPNPIDLRAEAYDFRLKVYYVTCVSNSGFGPIDLVGPTKHSQIDRIWTGIHGSNPHRFERRSPWLSIQTPRLYLRFRLGIYIHFWTKQVVLAWSVL